MKSYSSFLFFCFLLTSLWGAAQNIYVDGSVAGPGTGSQVDPYDEISDAVVYANSNPVDTIFIAAGTYSNNYDNGGTTNIRNQHLVLTKSDIVIYGSHPSNTIIDLGGGVPFIQVTANRVKFENIQVLGKGATSYNGAIHINNHSTLDSTYVNIKNCYFNSNAYDQFVGMSGSGGGAINAKNSTGLGIVLTVDSCQFLSNRVSGGTFVGGTIYVGQNNHLNMLSSRVACSETEILTTNSGGIIAVNGGTSKIYDCYISGGTTGRYGAALFATSSIGSKECLIRNSVFYNNDAQAGGSRGGAVCLDEDIQLTASNVEFSQNNAVAGFGNGGGAFAIYNGSSNANFINCTFADNTCGSGSDYGSINNEGSGTVRVLNCLFYGNTRNGTTLATATNGTATDLGGNLFLDPSFVNQAGFDYRIAGGSIAIDAGLASSGIYNAPTTDLNGTARVLPYDVGAYEFGSSLGVYSDDCSTFLSSCTDPGAPTGDAAQSFCSSPIPTVADLVAVGTSIQWYDAAVGGSLYLSTDALVDGNHYYASQTVSTCESAARLDVTVSITTAPDAGTASITDATICAGSTTTASSTQAGGLWSSSDLGVATVDANTGVVTGIGAGTATLTYTVSGAGVCLGTDDVTTVDVTVTAAPDAGTASITDATICEGSTTTASSTQAGGLWSSSDLGVATVDANTGLVTGIGAGTATLTYTVSGAGVCLGTDDVTTVDVTVTAAPDAGTASITDATICTGSTTTASSTQAGGLWSSSDLGVATVDANTGLVTGIGAGTATLTYTVSGAGVCLGTNATSTVDITVGSLSIPTGDVNQSFCLNDSPVVSDLSATGSTIVWYDAASNGNAYSGVEDLVDGQTYYAENTNGTCTSTSRLAVLVNISDMSFMLTSEVVPTCGKSDGEIQIDVTGGIGNYTYTWSNGSSTNSLLNIQDGVYTLNVTDDVNCSLDTLVRLTCESTTIPEIITPNGNGKNDTWVLELDPEAEVKIFNRWGNMIYSASPYLDDWDGKANEGMSLGKDYLPSGTYFYIIDKKDGKDPVSGYIELVR